MKPDDEERATKREGRTEPGAPATLNERVATKRRAKRVRSSEVDDSQVGVRTLKEKHPAVEAPEDLDPEIARAIAEAPALPDPAAGRFAARCMELAQAYAAARATLASERVVAKGNAENEPDAKLQRMHRERVEVGRNIDQLVSKALPRPTLEHERSAMLAIEPLAHPDFGSLAQLHGLGGMPGLMRVGALSFGEHEVPAAIAFGRCHVAFAPETEAGREKARAALAALLLRALASAPCGRCRLHALGPVPGIEAIAAPPDDADELLATLATRRADGTIDLVAIPDYPRALSEGAREHVRVIAQHGPAAGVCLAIAIAPGAAGVRGELGSLPHVELFVERPDGAFAWRFDSAGVVLDEEPPAALVRVVAELAKGERAGDLAPLADGSRFERYAQTIERLGVLERAPQKVRGEAIARRDAKLATLSTHEAALAEAMRSLARAAASLGVAVPGPRALAKAEAGYRGQSATRVDAEAALERMRAMVTLAASLREASGARERANEALAQREREHPELRRDVDALRVERDEIDRSLPSLAIGAIEAGIRRYELLAQRARELAARGDRAANAKRLQLGAFGAVVLGAAAIVAIAVSAFNANRATERATEALADAERDLDHAHPDRALEELASLAENWDALPEPTRRAARAFCRTATEHALDQHLAGEEWESVVRIASGAHAPCGAEIDRATLADRIVRSVLTRTDVPRPLAPLLREHLSLKRGLTREEELLLRVVNGDTTSAASRSR